MNKKICIKKIILWFITILFLETSFSLLISKNINKDLIINILFNSFIISLISYLITNIGKRKINIILTGIILLIIGVLFSTQAIFYKVFKVYFSLYDIALKDQLKSFMGQTIIFIIKNFFYIVWFMIPFIIFMLNKKKIENNKLNYKTIIILLIGIICTICINNYIINLEKDKVYSSYDIIHNVSNTSLSIQKLGVLKTYYIEGKRIIFGFKPKQIKVVKIKDSKKEKEEEKEYDNNILNLKLDNTGNQTIDIINSYIKEEAPTKKNKYTGMFDGYNLIYITAESFSELGVREDLTPTLYKMINNGFVFKNFYTPNNLSTIGGEFQSLTGLYPEYSILKKWREGTNTYPYSLANMFKNKGYSTFAYHNNYYNFQDRDKYLLSQGFTNYLACYNGLEKRMNCEMWPESDVDMIEVTKQDYINSTSPFLAYYMTVSGHFEYTFDDNSIAYKNKEYVDNLDLKETAKGYLATQIELDKALENLVKSLEENNKLDKTVFVLLADHYPYELDEDAINQLSTYERDNIEINHNALIIWNNKIDTEEINKPCMSSDVLPTVYKLFGIDYDSRLYTGKDILSKSHGIAVLENRSWISEKGKYDSINNKYYPNNNDTNNEEYINNVNILINNRINISKLIIENNYYKYLIE